VKGFTLNFRGKVLNVSDPLIMGILNVTPDSFYDGGKFNSEKTILEHAANMINEGADILDIGGMSTRPGAVVISEIEELARVIPALKCIIREFPDALLSIDTYRSGVAEAAIEQGARMINDIYAGRFDPAIFHIASKNDCPLVLMHMQGTPANMQQAPKYDDILVEIFDFLAERIGAAQQAGVKDIVLDPGFGFGKTLEQNYQLLKNIHIFDTLHFPVLSGLSRKRMIAGVLGVSPDNAGNGTTAAHMLALAGGARVLRVHDVKNAVEAIKIWKQYELA
jgi:dihydropteroate synthase